MLLIEFETNLKNGVNILKYRNVENDVNWYYLYIDIETLNTLLTNYGVISTLRMPAEPIYIDMPYTSKNIQLRYCGASVQMLCGNNSAFYLPIMEQNY
jgi:hypothetical protein